jgi:hypothetical protein
VYDFDEAKGAGTFLDLPVSSRGGAGGCVFAVYYRQQAVRKASDKTAIDPLRFAMAAMTFLARMKAQVPGVETRLFSFSTEPEFAEAWRRVAAWVGGRTVAVGALLTHSAPEGVYARPIAGATGGGGGGAGHDGTVNPGELAALAKLPWSPKGLLVLCGCNSGVANPSTGASLADRLAAKQGVPVLAQRGYASFSMRWDDFKAHEAGDDVCLWAYAKGRNSGWGGARIKGYLARVHTP